MVITPKFAGNNPLTMINDELCINCFNTAICCRSNSQAMILSEKFSWKNYFRKMNRLKRICVSNNKTHYYRNIRLLVIGNHTKLYFSVLETEPFPRQKPSPPPTFVDILLDHIPATWADSQEPGKSDTTNAFKQWVKLRELSEDDGKMLNRLKEHIKNGGHPDFPRLTKKAIDGDAKSCAKHMTDDYFTSLDKECFDWLKKQKKAYRNRSIHPWLQWKLEQLNVTLEW